MVHGIRGFQDVLSGLLDPKMWSMGRAGLRDHNRQFHAYSMKIMQYRPLHRLNTGFGQHCSLGSIVYVHINLYFKKSIHGV